MIEDSRSFLSQPACLDLCQRVERLTNHIGTTTVNLRSWWTSNIQWARNRVTLLGDLQDHELLIGRIGLGNAGGIGGARFNQIDDASLRSAVEYAERSQDSGLQWSRDLSLAHEPEYIYPKTAIWSDRTYDQPADERVALVRDLTDMAEKAGMVAAGSIVVAAIGTANYVTDRRMLYAPMTQTACSITVRDPDGTGSGWAGRSSYDWGRFDARALAAIALDKCLRSRNPVRIEPGRYTTILEPQATYDFVISQFFEKHTAYLDYEREAGMAQFPFYERPEVVFTDAARRAPVMIPRSKIGQSLVDARVHVGYTPEDPDLGVLPWVGMDNREPVRAATWFDGGVLTQLDYRSTLYRPGSNGGGGYRMEGGPTSVEEMIATTERGLLVTRLYGVVLIDLKSVLLSGVTRDGLWLIEHGKITKAVHNMRFTESPLLALNNLEQLGSPVPVLSTYGPAVVPPLKIRDFSFTALTDAI